MKARLYDLIERATSQQLSSPNLALNTDIATTINSAPDPRYAAGKACKRFGIRFNYKQPRIQSLVLSAVDHCVRSCGDPFHNELAKSNLLVDLHRVADRSLWSQPNIQHHVLALIQEWAFTLRPVQFSTGYSRLKSRGIPFPPRESGASQGGYPGLGIQHPGAATAGHMYAPQAAGNTTWPGEPPETQGRLTPGQNPQKMKEDLEVAGNTVALLEELLEGVPDNDLKAVKAEYIEDMVHQCNAMKNKLASLVQTSGISEEALLAQALTINDDAQKVLDRHRQLVEASEGRRPAPARQRKPVSAVPGGQAAEQEEGAGQTATAAAPSSNKQLPAHKKQASAVPLIDLLDIDWGAPTMTTAGSTAPTQNGGGGGGGGGVDPFAASVQPPQALVVPPTLPPTVSNNPFAPPPAPRPAPVLAAVAPPSESTDEAAPNPFMSNASFEIKAAAASPPPRPEPLAVVVPPAAVGNPFAATGVVHPLPSPVSSPFIAATPPATKPPSPLGDAFKDLVKIGPQAKEEKPPPPKGTPMRTISSTVTSSSPPSSSKKVTSSSPSAASQQQSTAANGQVGAQSDPFDAFEELASVRSSTHVSAFK